MTPAQRAVAGLVVAAGVAVAVPLTALADDGYAISAAGPAGAEPTQMSGDGYGLAASLDALGAEQPQGGGFSLTGEVVAVADVPAGGASRIRLPSVLRRVSP